VTRGGLFGSIMGRAQHDGLWLRTAQDADNLIEETTALGWRRVCNIPRVLVVFASPHWTRFLHVQYRQQATTAESWWTYAGE
jgi:hypothetical protein